MSIYIYINLPEKPSLLSGCIPMSNPIKVSEEAADHVQEVKATHSHLPSYLALPPGAETVKQSTQFTLNMPSSIFGDLYF